MFFKPILKVCFFAFQVNNGRMGALMGDTFPPSALGWDFRVCNEKSNVFYLGSFMQEKGRLCRYVSRNQSATPYMYLGNNLYDQLKTALRQDCGFAYSFIEKEQIDPKVRFSNGKLVLYGKNHADSSLDRSKKRDNHICLDAEPQSGKTVAGLLVIAHFRNLISSGQEELETQSDFEIQSDAETDIIDEEQSNLLRGTEESSSDEENPATSDLDNLKAELVKLDKFKRKQNKVNSEQKAKLKALQDLSKKQNIKLRRLKKLENTCSQRTDIIKQLQDFQTRQEQVNEEQKNEMKQLMESNESLKKINSDQKAEIKQLWEEFKNDLAKLEQSKSQQKSIIKDLETGIGGIEPPDSILIPNDLTKVEPDSSTPNTPDDYRDRDFREEQNYSRETEITNERQKRRSSFPVPSTSKAGNHDPCSILISVVTISIGIIFLAIFCFV